MFASSGKWIHFFAHNNGKRALIGGILRYPHDFVDLIDHPCMAIVNAYR